jgi:SLT domain-containing protein/phage-related protein
MVRAVRQGSFSLDGLGKSLKGSKGAVKKAGKANRTFSENMQVLKNKVEWALKPLGDQLVKAFQDLTPYIEKAIRWVANLAQKFSNLSPRTKKIIVIIGGLVAALGPVVGVLGTFAVALGALLSPIGLVVAAIGALAAGAVLVVVKWKSIKKFFKNLWTKVTQAFNGSIQKIKNLTHNIFGPIADFIEKTWGKIKGFFSKTTKKISGSVSKNWNKIKNKTSSAFSGAKNLATKAWGSLKKGVGKTSKLLTDVVKSRWKNLKNNTSTIYHGAKNVATTTWNGLKKGVSKASDLTKKGVSKAWTATKNTTSNLYTKARDKASSMWSSLKSRVTNHSNTAKKNIGSAWSKMRSNTSNLYTKARNKASSLFSSLKTRVSKHATTTGSKVRSAWSTLKSRTGTMFESIRKTSVNKMSKIVSWAKKMPGKIGHAIKSMAGKAASGAKHAAIRVARGFARGLNKVIGGANHVLDFIHVKHIPKVPIPKYKKGTKAHPGGPAFVNDGGGDELIRTPDGKMGIAPGRNTLVNLPKNSEVLPHKETKQLLNGIPAYKKGIGTKLKEMASNVFSYFKNPGKLLNKMYKKLGAFLPKMPGVAGDIAKGGFKKVKSGIASWIKKKISSFGFGGGGKVSGSLKSWIAKAIAVTGVPASWASGLATIAMHESGGRTGPSTINKWDSNWRRGTPSMGVMQTIMPTFDAFKVPGLGGIMDPVANIAAAINYIKHKYKNPYNTPGLRSLARGGPYIGYARGGIVNRRQFAEVAEEGPEGIIPLAFKRRRRALQLWARIGQRIGAFNRFAVPDIGGAGRTSNHVDYRAIGQAIAQEIERLLGDLTVQFPDRLTLLVDGKEVTAAIAEPMERELSDRRSDALYVRGIK